MAGYKLSKRFDQDISAVCAAFALQLDHNDRVASIRIAYGGMAAIPKRAVQTEALLTDRVWDEDSLQVAVDSLAKDFQPLSDMRASETYRARSAANLLKRFYLQTRTDAPLADTEVDVFQCEARSA